MTLLNEDALKHHGASTPKRCLPSSQSKIRLHGAICVNWEYKEIKSNVLLRVFLLVEVSAMNFLVLWSFSVLAGSGPLTMLFCFPPVSGFFFFL